MFSKLYSAVGVLAISTLLACGGFVGFLFAAGKLNAARLETIAATLRGELDNRGEASPTSMPTSHPAAEAAMQPDGVRSVDEIRQKRIQSQLQRAMLERAGSDLAARQSLLNQSLAHLMSLQEDFEKGKQNWAAQKKKLTDTAKDEGFQRELLYVSKLAPKQAKEHVLRTWQKQKADAVRLFMALDSTKGQRILEQFKTTEEITIMHELLEQLRLADVDHLVAGSRKTSGDDKP